MWGLDLNPDPAATQVFVFNSLSALLQKQRTHFLNLQLDRIQNKMICLIWDFLGKSWMPTHNFMLWVYKKTEKGVISCPGNKLRLCVYVREGEWWFTGQGLRRGEQPGGPGWPWLEKQRASCGEQHLLRLQQQRRGWDAWAGRIPSLQAVIEK